MINLLSEVLIQDRAATGFVTSVPRRRVNGYWLVSLSDAEGWVAFEGNRQHRAVLEALYDSGQSIRVTGPTEFFGSRKVLVARSAEVLVPDAPAPAP